MNQIEDEETISNSLVPNKNKMITDDEDHFVHATLYSLFKIQAIRTPDRNAIVDAYGEYSYQYLYEKAQYLSQCLYQNNVHNNQLIAVLCEKGHYQVISMLGILGCGAAYLPLDDDWPLGRIEEILEEGHVKQLIVTKKQLTKIKNTTISNKYIIVVIEELKSHLNSVSIKNIPSPEAQDIAYVIFTSGSTGKPKGVVINHEGVLATIRAVNERFAINSRDSVLALSKISFDLSVYDIFGILIVGGTIIFPHDEKAKDPSHWYELIVKHNISVWNSVPQFMQLLISYLEDEGKKLNSLKCILLSGDWIPLTLPVRIKERANDAIVMSLGGATECSIWSIWYEINNVDMSWKSIPYGNAMPSQEIYILDAHGATCSIGITGEIYIGGKGVALCYWNDKEKTGKSFINHKQFGKLFKTGDLGRWNKDGYVEFLGRKDHQVKLYGHRIELGEISSRLRFYPEIMEAIVLVKMINGNNDLVVYYISSQNLNDKVLKKYLSYYLPYYMVPHYYHRIKALPLTANGKIDHASLLARENGNTSKNYIAPSNELEIKVCCLWAEILGLEKIGIKDDFFRSGGNSMLATHLAYKMSREMNLSIKPMLIFANPNVEDFLLAVQDCEKNKNIEKICTNKALLSYQQESLLKEELLNPGTSSFPIVFELLKKCNIHALKKCLVDIVKNHEILRTVFEENVDGNWYQIVRDEELLITEKYVDENQFGSIFRGLYREDFDLTLSFPIKITIYHAETISYLIIMVHTIAFDGWSINVFMNYIESLYLNYVTGNLSKEIVPLEIQYTDYATWQRKHVSNNYLIELIQYWCDELESYEPFCFKARRTQSARIDSAGDFVEFSLDEKVSKELRELSSEYGTTLYTIFLSALYILIYQYVKKNDLAFVLFIANRSSQQIEGLIGYFVNKIIMRMHIDTQKSVLHLMHNVHRNLIDSETYREAPFELVMKKIGLKHRDEQRKFLPVMLNVHDFRGRLTENLLSEHLKYVSVQEHYDIAKFDLGFYIDDGQKQVKGLLNYSTSLYDKAFVLRLKDSYTSILKNFVIYKDIPIKEAATYVEVKISDNADPNY